MSRKRWLLVANSLPTPEEMLAAAQRELDNAYRALGDAGDWLRSDWKPGSRMTKAQAERRSRMFRAIADAKTAINQGR